MSEEVVIKNPASKGVLDPKKVSRRNVNKVLSETKEILTLEITHVPQKGEKIKSTRRKDHLYDPNQKFTAGSRSL